jgi:lipopolysaccharide/colanic/teichoic acid biosynthesis glycosyltransferase
MPEPETPVEHRATGRPRSASWIKSAKTRVATPRPARRIVVLGPPADLPRALLHPAVMSGRFQIVESIALDIETPDAALAGLGDVAEIVRTGRADTLLVTGEVGPVTMRRVADVALAFHCEVLAVMPTEALAEHEPVIVWTGDGHLIQLTGLPRHPAHNVAKRVIDVTVAVVALLVAAPLLAVLAVLIMIESPGNPIFKHSRVGFRGRKFNCLKLRTMRADAESMLRSDPAMYEAYRQNHFKIPDGRDPRVTRIGRFLRRTSLDELPQLWNILVGEMSLVGPRPVVEEELAMYGDDRDLMLSVRPGLTGAWAVNGRQSVGYPDRCELELGYVRERTMWRDAEIVIKTAAVVLHMKLGAE